jgi:UDP-N-acetylmuramoylalanine--D-glutamate ligase
MDYSGLRVAVWGAARSGIAAANLLAELGADVYLSDQRKEDELNLEQLDEDVTFVGGGNALCDASILVPSPGIPPSNAALRAASLAGVRVMSEIELAASVARAPIVAITGTDGKSTTTEMIAAVVEAGGKKAFVAGNIGDPFSRRVLEAGPDDVLVIEVSAFQLWSCQDFQPAVAVVTNIAEDHAEYFDGDVAAYIGAKARVLQDMTPDAVAVLRHDDPVVRNFSPPDGVKVSWFSPVESDQGWAVVSDHLAHNGERIMPLSEIPVPGPHNVANALSALAAGHALGLETVAMLDGLRSFKGLKHRLEWVRTLDGVRWYDDSKATNPHAAAAGLKAISTMKVVITGGYDKGLELAPFVSALENTRHLIVTGSTAERTILDVSSHWKKPHIEMSRANDMQDAVRRAAAAAHPGDTVILSPAASSFDAYQSYAHRGQVYQQAVKSLLGASK